MGSPPCLTLSLRLSWAIFSFFAALVLFHSQYWDVERHPPLSASSPGCYGVSPLNYRGCSRVSHLPYHSVMTRKVSVRVGFWPAVASSILGHSLGKPLVHASLLRTVGSGGKTKHTFHPFRTFFSFPSSAQGGKLTAKKANLPPQTSSTHRSGYRHSVCLANTAGTTRKVCLSRPIVFVIHAQQAPAGPGPVTFIRHMSVRPVTFIWCISDLSCRVSPWPTSGLVLSRSPGRQWSGSSCHVSCEHCLDLVATCH